MAKVKAKRKRKERRTPSRVELIRMFYSVGDAAKIAGISPSTWSIALTKTDWPSTTRHIGQVVEHLKSELNEISTSGTSRTYREWAQATQRLLEEAE